MSSSMWSLTNGQRKGGVTLAVQQELFLALFFFRFWSFSFMKVSPFNIAGFFGFLDSMTLEREKIFADVDVSCIYILNFIFLTRLMFELCYAKTCFTFCRVSNCE
jgi:hypothetical protein